MLELNGALACQSYNRLVGLIPLCRCETWFIITTASFEDCAAICGEEEVLSIVCLRLWTLGLSTSLIIELTVI